MKRKAGLFKKAHELAVLCQVELALIITTPENRTYEYTAGNLEDILVRRQELPLEESKTPADFAVDDDDDESSGTERRNTGPISSSRHHDSSVLRRNYSIHEKVAERPRLKVQIPHAEAPVATSLAGAAGDHSAGLGSKDRKGSQQGATPAADSVARASVDRPPSGHDARAVASGVPQRQYRYNEPPMVSPVPYQQFPNRSGLSQLTPTQQQQQQSAYFPGYTPIAPQGYFGAPFPVNYGLPSYPGQLPPPNGRPAAPNAQPLSNGSYNRWNGVTPQGHVGQYYSAVPEPGAKHEPGMASATAASMPSRYVNDTLMSPSNYFSMEWSVFDQQNSAGATGSAKAVPTSDASAKTTPVSAEHDKSLKEEGLDARHQLQQQQQQQQRQQQQQQQQQQQLHRLSTGQPVPPAHGPAVIDAAEAPSGIADAQRRDSAGVKRPLEAFPTSSSKWKKQDT